MLRDPLYVSEADRDVQSEWDVRRSTAAPIQLIKYAHSNANLMALTAQNMLDLPVLWQPPTYCPPKAGAA